MKRTRPRSGRDLNACQQPAVVPYASTAILRLNARYSIERAYNVDERAKSACVTGSYHLYRRAKSTARYRQRSSSSSIPQRDTTHLDAPRWRHALRGRAGGTALRNAPRANDPTDVHLSGAALYTGHRKRGRSFGTASLTRGDALDRPESLARRRRRGVSDDSCPETTPGGASSCAVRVRRRVS